MCFVKEKDQNTNIFIQTFYFGKILISVTLSFDGCYSNTSGAKTDAQINLSDRKCFVSL